MSEDLRVIKTRSNIRKEFLSLLEQYEFRAITAVSYTHLDVYKRQAWVSRLSFM